MRMLISAGEASGEMYGAQLIAALRRKYAHVGAGVSPAQPSPSSAAKPKTGQVGTPVPTQTLDFFGVGGDCMRAAGCDTIVDSKDLAVVGITEILAHLPKIWGLFHKLIAEADKRKPDLAIVIDSPAFNWRVAREMHKRGVPVVYYVAPQFWAWRQGRVRLLREYITKALVIFPFEEKFYRDRGVDATFIGHPLADLPKPNISRDAFAAQHNLDSNKHWIALMPGSRVKEVRMNVPEIIAAATRLGATYEFLLPVASTLAPTLLNSLLGGNANIRLVPETLRALAFSRAGIIASGTATVEAAMMNLPFVMVYRVTPLTYLLGKSRVKVPHFAMVNLIAEREVVPELVQHDFTAEKIVAHMNQIIPEGSARAKMLAGLAEVRARLGEGAGHLPAADRAADIIRGMLRNHHL
ncbi:MAG: lipid-A-disaccharide synthase [Terriglobales bacterium]